MPTSESHTLFELCRLPVWKYAAAFYPAKIVKTAELDPDGHYIFAAHPHGIFCSSLFLAFSTEALGFSKVRILVTPMQQSLQAMSALPLQTQSVMRVALAAGVESARLQIPVAGSARRQLSSIVPDTVRPCAQIFPGIDVHFTTLVMHFRCPLVRDYILLHGMLDCSRDTCKRVLMGCALSPVRFQLDGCRRCSAKPSGPSVMPHEPRIFRRLMPSMCAFAQAREVRAVELLCNPQVAVFRKSGQSMALAVGGALESLYVEPGTMDIIVQRRQAGPHREAHILLALRMLLYVLCMLVQSSLRADCQPPSHLQASESYHRCGATASAHLPIGECCHGLS
jgi:hypothetical protein